MSENENKPGNESRSDFAEQPSPTPEPSEATSQPQHIACPKCSALVLAGAQLCRVCGSQLPSTTSPSWPSASLSQHPRRNVRRIVGIALIAVLMIGVAGYVAYQQVGKYSERLYADQSLSQV